MRLPRQWPVVLPRTRCLLPSVLTPRPPFPPPSPPLPRGGVGGSMASSSGGGEAASGERDVRSNNDVPGADFIRNPIVGNVRTVFNDDHLDAKIARNIDALVRDDDDSEAEACGDRVDLVLHRACITIDKNFAHLNFT